MNIEHFTEKAREAISDAAQLARQHNHAQVEVEHLLAALLAQEGGVVPLTSVKRTAKDHRHASNRPCESRDEGLGVKRCARPGFPTGG